MSYLRKRFSVDVYSLPIPECDLIVNCMVTGETSTVELSNQYPDSVYMDLKNLGPDLVLVLSTDGSEHYLVKHDVKSFPRCVLK